MTTGRIKEVLKESDDSANRSLAKVEQTKQLGISTVKELQHQGQQLKQTEETIDVILYKQKEGERHLNVIANPLGAVTNKLFFHHDKIKHAKEKKKKINKKNIKQTSQQEVKVKSSVYMPAAIDQSLLDAEDKRTLQQTDATVAKISGLVEDLKQIAIEQGEEIDAHNARLPRLQKKMIEAEINMDRQITKIRKGY